MRGLDDTDRDILSLLLNDGRRPYSDIAEQVDLSAPAVSERVDRLQELGVVRRFTVSLDQSMLREGIPVLVDLQVQPGHSADVKSSLRSLDAIEHVFLTADERLTFNATVPDGDVQTLLDDALDFGVVESYDVDLLADSSWSPSLGEVELATECAECGNTVTSEGESTRLGGDRYHFCCASCESQFVEQYEKLQDAAEVDG